MALKVLKEVASQERSPKRFYCGILHIIQDLKNPSDPLKIFSIKDAVSKKKHFLIIGSLIKTYSLQKHESSGTSIKVLILKGAILNDDSKFRVTLFNDCAVDAETARLKEGDLLGFYEPTVVSNCAAKHTTESTLFKHQIVFGRQKTDDSLFFFMRKEPESIFQPLVIADSSIRQVKESNNKNGKVVKKTLKRYSEISYIDVPEVKRNKNDSPSNSDESGVNSNPQKSKAPIKSSQPTTAPKPIRTYETLSRAGSKSSVEGKDAAEPVGVVNENHNSESISEDDAQVRECNDENVTGTSTVPNKTSCKTVIISRSGGANNKSENVLIVKDNYEYKKLNETHSLKEINLYAVVVDVMANPRPCKGNKMSLVVFVTDDSIFPKNFRIFIFYEPSTVLNVQKHQIMRFHRLKLELSNGRIDGRVFHGWDVVSFDPSKINRTLGSIKGISCAKKCSFTEKDEEIIFNLKEWMDSMILIDLERELARTEELVQKGCDNLVLPANNIPSEAIGPKSCEDFEKYLENIDQKLVLVPELSQLSSNTECGFVCDVIRFHKLDNDRAALIVGDGQSCPLKLTSFPLGLPNCKTLDDCIKASLIKQNSLHVSILLENISTKPVCEQLQNAKEIFVSHCLTPEGDTKEKSNLVIKCNLLVGDILLLDARSKRFLKKFIRKPKNVNDQLKRKCEDSAPSPKKGASVSSDENLPKKKTLRLNLEKFNVENSNGIKESSENAVTPSNSSQGPANDNETLNRIDNSENCSTAKAKDHGDGDPGKLASSQLSTCVTKLKKLNEGNKKARVIRAADAPDITKLKHEDKSIFFASLTNTLNNKKKVEKETADINSLDEILLSPMSRRASLMVSNNETSVNTIGSSPMHDSRNYSFDSNIEFEHIISASVMTSPKSRKNLGHALSDIASETSRSSDETYIGDTCDLKNHLSAQAKFKISPGLSETSKVSGNNKRGITKAVPVPKKLPYEVQSPGTPSSSTSAGSGEKLVSSPSKSNRVESSSRTEGQEKSGVVKSMSHESLPTSEQPSASMRNKESLSTIEQENQGTRNKPASPESLLASQDVRSRLSSPESISANKEERRDLRKKTSPQESLPASEQQNRGLRKRTTHQESLVESENQSRVTRSKKTTHLESLVESENTSPKESAPASEQLRRGLRKRTSQQESAPINEQPNEILTKEASEQQSQDTSKKFSQEPSIGSKQQIQGMKKKISSQESLSLTEQHSWNMKSRLRRAAAIESKKAKNSPQNLSQNSESKNPADKDVAESSPNLDTSKYSSAKDSFSSPKPPAEVENMDDADTVINLNVQQHVPHSSTPLKNHKSAYTEAWIRTQNDSYDLDTSLHGNLNANDSRDKTISSEYFLLKIEPTDEETGEFLIVVGFCASGCKRYQVIKSFPGNMDSYVCKICQSEGTNAVLSLRFMMKLCLVACKTGENVEALLTSPCAEIFLGCKIKDFVEDEKIRTLVLRNLKFLQIHVPTRDENGVAISQKLTLLLESKIINTKEQRHVVNFEVPKVFASRKETPQL